MYTLSTNPLEAKRKMKRMMYGLIFLAVVVFTTAGLYIFPQYLQESQDIRQQASLDTGLVKVTATPGNSTLTPNQVAKITLNVNTNALQTDGVQLVFNIKTDVLAAAPKVSVLTASGLAGTYQSVTPIAGGYTVNLLALPTSIDQPFASSQDTPFAEIEFTPVKDGSVEIVFDGDDSLSTIHKSDPPKDELKTIASLVYRVASPVVTAPTAAPATNPSPVSTSAPLSSPVVQPTSPVVPSPVIIAAPVAVPSPVIQANTPPSNENTEATTNSVGGTTPSPETIAYVNPDQATQPGSTSQSDNTTALGELLDDTSMQPDNSYEQTEVDTQTYQTTSNNNTTTQDNTSWLYEYTPQENMYTAPETQPGYCNAACASSRDCAANFRCVSGSCRLATAPNDASCSGIQSNSSTTYSPDTQTYDTYSGYGGTINYDYNTAMGYDMPVDSSSSDLSYTGFTNSTNTGADIAAYTDTGTETLTTNPDNGELVDLSNAMTAEELAMLSDSSATGDDELVVEDVSSRISDADRFAGVPDVAPTAPASMFEETLRLLFETSPLLVLGGVGALVAIVGGGLWFWKKKRSA